VLTGLKRACSKRPVSMDTIERTVDRIERELQDAGEKEVPTTRIGDAVMAALRNIDDVAYVRFASVYRSFRDVAELMDELKNLVDARGGPRK
jgi:transcriptional repressor NrdR